MTAPFTRPARGATLSGLATHKCTLIGWMIGWASFTYVSAAVRWLQTGAETEVRGIPMAVFTVADKVPPYAKIAFGALFLLLLYVLPRLSLPGGRAPTGMVAGLVAAVAVLCAAPFDYFAATSGSLLWNAGAVATAPHLLLGAGAGLVWAAARARCERKTEADQ
ncbi:hypothetical protein [Sphingomonas sp. LM7]|uniref:hypothetical protein n=1 Tax=Sphingomonas sp. LM7 TaxID=1938607 RepID=UPI000983F75A|nr:hypothetical protein [Sphingomonas sp. LM7]AQR72438.1 hypothetical protein BXU08_01040 [Sphingomonas sp. LM7]